MGNEKVLKIIVVAVVVIVGILIILNITSPNPNPSGRTGSLSPEFHAGQAPRMIDNPDMIFVVTGFDYGSQSYIGRMNFGYEEKWPRNMIDGHFKL